MRHLIPFLLLSALACDAEPVQQTRPLTFRGGGKPSVLYLSQYDADPPMTLDGFSKLVQGCAEAPQPELALTYTVYPTETEAQFVIGLGFTTYASPALTKCFRDEMWKRGAQAIDPGP